MQFSQLLPILRAARFICVLPLLFLPLPATAAEGLQSKRPAVLFDAPSAEARPLLILTGRQPLKTIRRIHGWRKVQMFSDDIGWVRDDEVTAALAGVVVGERAAVRTDPNVAAPAVFVARRGVVLEVLGRRQEWIQVLHLDGESGYIAAADIWLNH